MGEIGDRDLSVPNLTAHLHRLQVGTLKEVVEQPQLVHYLERRGMDGVAPQVAQEIGVFLEDDVNPGASEQEGRTRPARPPPATQHATSSRSAPGMALPLPSGRASPFI